MTTKTTKDTTKVYAHTTMPKREHDKYAAEKTARERLAPIVEGVPEAERGAAEALRDEIVFMSGAMALLKQFCADHGVVAVDDRTGAVKESPAIRSYNSMVPRQCSALKQLCKMSEVATPEVDPLMAFINGDDGEDDED